MDLETIFPTYRSEIQTLEPEVKGIWGLKIFFSGVLTSLLLLIVDVIWLPFTIVFVGFPAFFALGVTLVAALILPPLYYRAWRFLILSDEIIIQRGVFVRSIAFIPLARVQHIEVIRSLMDRIFNLSTVAIFTAGTRKSDARIPGLDPHYALSLRTFIRSRITVEDTL